MYRHGGYRTGGQYGNGGPPIGRPYNENYYKNGGPPPGPPPPPHMGMPPPPYRDRLTRSQYPPKNNGSFVRGGRVGTLKMLAAAQLIVGLLLLLLGIVCFALGPINMSMVLLTGTCMLWCPMGSIATGVVGLFLNRGNTRDFVCVRRGYQVMCLLNACLFMVLLALTTGFVNVRTFDSDLENISANEKLLLGFLATFLSGATVGGMEPEDGDPMVYLSIAAIIIALCCLNEIFAIISAAIICCGAPFAIDEPEPIVLPPVEPMRPPRLEPEPLQEIVVRRPPVEEEYYRAPEPVYASRDLPPPRRSEIVVLPSRRPRSRRSYDDGDAEYLRKYYKDYYRDYEKMMDKFKDAKRKYGTIRSKDFDRYIGPSRRSRHRRARSIDENSYGYGDYDRYDRYDRYARRDVYSDY